MKTLIIAEKPSVARDIAAALGLSGMESNEIVISHCIGHLVRLNVPEAVPSAPLPIIPNEFKLVVIDKVKEQYKKLETLMKRNDISTIVNACDAGREGELIFRLVYNKANCKKPIERMWLQSMTKQAIQTAWQSRQSGNKYDALYDAAISRSEADWLYGINGSRSVKSAIGRVMTPTLAMITNRFLDNKNFVPKTFYQIIGTFKVKNGTYEGKMQANEDVDLKLDNKADAEAIIAAFADCEVQSVDEVTTPQRKLPPMLFHLTSLQQVANKQYGLSASETLQIAQALYEKHKVITYPRTDADALPTDYVDTVKTTLSQLSKITTHAKTPITENWINGNSRVFNDAKISDHFAIVPTGTIPNELTQNEQIIYDLIVKRFIAVFYPAAEYLQTVRHTTLREGFFKSTGRILKSSGWLAVYGGTDEEEDNEPKLPLLMENEKPVKESIRIHEGQTKPPALFTEATLLKAMEMAGKEIDDEDLSLVH
ncbi:DNA topoisomerase III [Oligella ureolytica]